MKKKLVAMLTALCCVAVSIPAIPVNAEEREPSAFAILGKSQDGCVVMDLRVAKSSYYAPNGTAYDSCPTYLVKDYDEPYFKSAELYEELSQYSAGDIVDIQYTACFPNSDSSTGKMTSQRDYYGAEKCISGKLSSVFDSEPVQMVVRYFGWESNAVIGLSDGETNYIYHNDWAENPSGLPYEFDWSAVEEGDVIQFYTYNGFPVIPEKVTGHNEIMMPSHSGTCGENATWTLENGVLTISGTGAMDDYDLAYDGLELAVLNEETGKYEAPKVIYMPWKSYLYDIRKIVIEDGITHIGNYAFQNAPVSSVEIPDSVTSIGGHAFESCSRLKEIQIPQSVTTIGIRTFGGSGLTSVEIPDSVTEIGNSAFGGTLLSSVTIPDSIKVISDGTFSNCKNLKSVTIPESVEEIQYNAFSMCESLSSVVLPEGLKTLGQAAFLGCSQLESVTIPETLTNFEGEDFKWTPWLENQIAENPMVIVNHVLLNAQNVKGDVVIPDDVTKIAKFAFYDNKEVTSVHIPDSVTDIDVAVFENCKALTSVRLPRGLNKIPNGMFEYCSNLQNVYIPESAEVIGAGAFYKCNSVKSVVIPETVKEVEGNTFFINSLEEITFLNPDCIIADDKATIINSIGKPGEYFYNMTIYGYENSTAQAYAEKYGINFVSLGEYAGTIQKGDINDSGEVSVVDVLATNQYLLGIHRFNPRQKCSADVNRDGIVNDSDTMNILKYIVKLVDSFDTL